MERRKALLVLGVASLYIPTIPTEPQPPDECTHTCLIKVNETTCECVVCSTRFNHALEAALALYGYGFKKAVSQPST